MQMSHAIGIVSRTWQAVTPAFCVLRHASMACKYSRAVFRSQRLARPARSFKKQAHWRLKAWMHECAPNILHTARLDSCRHEAGWAAAGTLSGSPVTITGPGAHDAFSQIVCDKFCTGVVDRSITF